MRDLGEHESRALKILEYLMRGLEIRLREDHDPEIPGPRLVMNDDGIVCVVAQRSVDGKTDEVLLPVPITVDDLIGISENLDEEHFLSLAGAVAVFKSGPKRDHPGPARSGELKPGH